MIPAVVFITDKTKLCAYSLLLANKKITECSGKHQKKKLQKQINQSRTSPHGRLAQNSLDSSNNSNNVLNNDNPIPHQKKHTD